MICRYVTSFIDVETVLENPEIKPKLGAELSELPELIFIGCYLENKIASLLCVEMNGRGHFYCLKPFRKNAREFLKESLKLSGKIYFNPPNKSIENFLSKLGFTKSGDVMLWDSV